MKKSLKKLTLNKKSVSDLSQKVKGGFKQENKTLDTILTTDTGPTALTMCYICPPDTL
ncbi:hypothetical protein [Kordia sp.]|uniref:hypothetical protein n=1 Tax=Kordia sp. TaxID=1965332 RepID=UPI003D267967